MQTANETQSSPQRRKKGWMPLIVNEIVRECHDTVTICLTDQVDGGRPFDFEPGQYITFRFDDLAEKPVARSYTMSGSPNQGDQIYVTIKKVDGGLVSSWFVDQLAIGQVLRARGPLGKFCCPKMSADQELCMIAAGSGVTPFVSILRQYHNQLATGHLPGRMSLLVSYRSLKDLILWQELTAFRSDLVKVEATLSREKDDLFRHGRIDEQMVADFCQYSFADKDYMVCGPDPMMAAVAKFLQDQGVDKQRIHLESFA